MANIGFNAYSRMSLALPAKTGSGLTPEVTPTTETKAGIRTFKTLDELKVFVRNGGGEADEVFKVGYTYWQRTEGGGLQYIDENAPR